MMNRSDYKHIAHVLRDSSASTRVCVALGERFQQDDPNFDLNRWNRDCYGHELIRDRAIETIEVREF